MSRSAKQSPLVTTQLCLGETVAMQDITLWRDWFRYPVSGANQAVGGSEPSGNSVKSFICIIRWYASL